MSYYGRRYSINQNLQQAIDYQAQASNQSDGWSLPCQVVSVSSDGLFVTVNICVNDLSSYFQQITIPIMQSQYVRLPIQVGDVGVARKADISLYPISGQKSGGNPNFGQDGNYEAVLAFEPISTKGNKNGISGFPQTPDVNAVWIYGPDGVILQDHAGNCIATISHDKTKGITLVVGNNNVTVNSNQASIAYGSNNVEVTSTQASMTFGANSVVVNASGVTITGSLSINGQAYTAHEHGAGTYVAGSNPVTGVSGGKV